ncbi:MAG: ABC transporter ATP-binding protein, partial [Alphaproteobacteria bacterium]|nr:ABC transporter ATP-binding protein [Alphaproteobacteria bacterium]
LDGRITAGELLVFLAYFRSITAPTRRIAKTARMVGRASVAVERIADYLFETPSVVESALALTPSCCVGRLEFEEVSFGYRPGPNILQDVSFCLEPGRGLALVGPTGAGKSTIAGLISRFYDPVLGRVLLDGRDLRGLSLGFVRRQVALVLQEPVIFRASVWENICYGLEGATRDDAISAAKAVGVDAVIGRLPGGYDCIVSERGQTLSGGQRQCISIARAMLSGAPVVVLDEPSSSLDAMTEGHLMEAVKRLTENRAALIIAHRLKTVVEADEILVLDQGRIVQRGRHAQLLRDAGIYERLWASFSDKAVAGTADDCLSSIPCKVRTA